MTTQYDYIIAGAGCAGLSLLMHMLEHPALRHKKILLIDKSAKTANDRTWCFWESGQGHFEPLVCKTWNRLWVKHYEGSLPLAMGGYAYKMIRSLDFYRHCFQKVRQQANVTWLIGDVTEIDTAAGTLRVEDTTYNAEVIFSSMLPAAPVLGKKDIYLLQHFRGWWVETETDFFDPQEADLMNFRTHQQHGCAFMYVLPLSPRKALIEYTLFSQDTLTDAQYNEGLQAFVQDELKLPAYTIQEVENGVIPMTTYPFMPTQGKLVYIGTAGGQTKASTGYTFQNIQRHSKQLVSALAAGHFPDGAGTVPWRFPVYDAILLRVLKNKMYSGADIFYKLFKKNKAPRVLRFLDNQSSFYDELHIMNSTPQSVFIHAAWLQYLAR